MGKSEVGAKSCNKIEPIIDESVTDVYICVFFDGTGNNMYEQEKKRDNLLKKAQMLKDFIIDKSSIKFSVSPTLFGSQLSDLEKHGMINYEAQWNQAKQDYKICEDRNDKEGNGGWKYSNVAILRSIAKEKEITETTDNKGNHVIGKVFNLYIEGSGQLWDKGNDKEGLGMGTGRTGVVGLVSKAVVFVTDYVNSIVSFRQRPNVNLHFAVFGFSRGSTCGRLFSFLIADDVNKLPRKDEFKQYLPTSYWKNGKMSFLEEYQKKRMTVDFLGIYDTVSSIGFFLKEERSTGYGINRFKAIKDAPNKDKETYVNTLHPFYTFTDAHNNFHCNNVTDYGLYSPQCENVKHTFHICAMDEYRENFALVDLGTQLNSHCTEVFMPGCHSDIGGGYMFGDAVDRYTLRCRIKGLPTVMLFNTKPTNLTPFKQVSQETLKELGWLDRTTEKRKESFKLTHLKKGRTTEETDAQTAFIFQNDDKVEFERWVKEGYSNIALEMMRKRAVESLGKGLKGLWPDSFLPFKETLPSRFNEPAHKAVCDVREMSKTDFREGERHYICPPSIEKYADLRRNFLHFTCTDELNLEKLHFKASGANIGNPPNWRKMDDHYLLCRIVYHGSCGDNDLSYMDSL